MENIASSVRGGKKRAIAIAVAAVLGVAVSAESHAVTTLQTVELAWDGVFSFLDPTGSAIANTSLSGKSNNQFLTPVSGTLTLNLDPLSGGVVSGAAGISPFEWGAGTLPWVTGDVTLDPVGDGQGGPGTLVLGNMLFNWNGNQDVPISIVWDMAGLLSELAGVQVGDLISGVGAVPAADGTYLNSTQGYVDLGPTPVATTEWNTTLADGCAVGSCIGVDPSGASPLLVDTAINEDKSFGLPAPILGIGGVPMPDGPFTGINANFDMSSLTVTSISNVPVPAAIWLFASGLVLLAGSRRRPSRVN